MPRYTFRYLLLAVILACACWSRGSGAWNLFKILRHPDAMPEMPFPIMAATRTIGATNLRLDQILAVNGRPLTAEKQLEDIVFSDHPGDKITLTLSEPSGHAVEKTLTIPSQQINFGSFERMGLALCLDVLVPLVCIFLGAFAVALRPADRNAWLLLLLLISFAELAGRDYGGANIYVMAWSSTLAGLWPLFMMLFGIYFPEPLPSRFPWVRYPLLLLSALAPLTETVIVLIWEFDINAAFAFRPLLVRLSFTQSIVGILAISSYFVNIGTKSNTATSADSRRRLRILLRGSWISLTPAFLLTMYSLIRQHDMLDVEWIIAAIALFFLSLLPFALAYVIVVERAMDLSFVVRRSLQYGLARVGFRIARIVLIILAVNLVRLLTLHGNDQWKDLEFAAVGLGFVALRKGTANRASQWLDRRFFRESYDAERVLAGLAKNAGGFVEIPPLLENVSATVSATLHVPDIVILLREGDLFVPRYSTRPGEPMNIPASGRIVKNLRDRNEALEIYFDKPPLWIRSLSAEELQTLDHMRTQLMLPLTTRGELTGIFSLGPKLSEVPYSDTDVRLLQAIAWQMSIALENSRLVASLASEAAYRERANRELEIAREVQERLFPQNFPPIPGLDCAGYCRPARGVGGDYYDFIQLEDGRLGIAIGDVSGKGIAAALLMASLQASLRGQAMAGVHNLSALMHNVNKLVFEASTSNRYATFFYGEYDTATRLLTFANAGHNAPVILRGDEVLRLEAGGPVVGLLQSAQYGQDACTLQPGDIFIAYTDGISEAMNERDEEWEEDQFIAAARDCRNQPARQMIQTIFKAADAFTGNAKQYDDMTLLIVKLED